jgi:hypothetical protein
VHVPTKCMGEVAGGASARASAVTTAVPAADPAASVLAPLRPEDAAEQRGAAAFYDFFLSYSADFASGKPNPPGSGYHWSLQHSRFGVTPAMADKLAQRKRG